MAGVPSLYALLLATLAAPAGWTGATEGGGPSASPEEEARLPGAVFRVVDGALEVTRRGETRRVPTSDGRDPGVVRDLAADPAGLLFVAAEHGLYLADAESAVLDRVEREEGAPLGAPTSVVVDARRRVWLATDEDWGVLDPSFFWGRSLAGLVPGTGPYRIAAVPEGLRVTSTAGATTYVPDRAPAPRVARVAIDGEEVAAGARLERGYHDAQVLAAEGTGSSLRWRVDGHHVWRELPGEVDVHRLSPGRHRIEIVAIDRDLNRSAPFAFTVEVAFPFTYEPRFVLAAGAALGVLLLLLFLRSERRHARPRPARAVLSTGLALVLSVQVAAGVAQHARGWPFVGFSMYSGRYDEGDYVFRPTLRGLDERGVPRRIPVQAAGVAADSPWQVLRALVDGGDAAARDYIAAYERRFPGRTLAGLQACSERVRLTAHGGIEVAPLVLSHYVAPPHDLAPPQDLPPEQER